MLLDEVVAEAYSAPHPAKDLRLDSPSQKVIRAWREVPSPSEASVSDSLQQHEPPTIAPRENQPQAQSQGQARAVAKAVRKAPRKAQLHNQSTAQPRN